MLTGVFKKSVRQRTSHQGYGVAPFVCIAGAGVQASPTYISPSVCRLARLLGLCCGVSFPLIFLITRVPPYDRPHDRTSCGKRAEHGCAIRIAIAIPIVCTRQSGIAQHRCGCGYCGPARSLRRRRRQQLHSSLRQHAGRATHAGCQCARLAVRHRLHRGRSFALFGASLHGGHACTDRTGAQHWL